MKTHLVTLALTGALVMAQSGSAQTNARCNTDPMLVFDASGSMAEMGHNGIDSLRIIDARAALHAALPQITPLRDVGLITYGPGGDDDSCSHVALRRAPAPDASAEILAEIDGIEPDGNTALTRAVGDAARVLGAPGQAGVVVLISDGNETCGGAPCQLAAELAATAPSLVVHVIGFKVSGKFFGWEGGDCNPVFEVPASPARCLADRTGGLYVSTETVDDLVQALKQTLGCPLFSDAGQAHWRG
ncbi:vWA domain-containing protein [Sedimentitalea todarodis]|uniref:VWA domain-containing protein n=1 Tax=Sedimentitalea todarodis TaxID=1631240 RepID=A0ABU3VFG2_9RHOB|nr:VWA domain-containing protein [Sedimentitalea todarodis]MDU9004916.1 VWA domain-containing protein [Sedimentitalea todarodis]